MNILKNNKIQVKFNSKNLIFLYIKNKKDLKKIFNEIIFDLDEKKISVGLHLVSKDKIKTLNKETRGINKVTDVLSFPMLEHIEDYFYLGDIFINVDILRKQAKEINSYKNMEMKFLFMHGLLHLIGYDHQNISQERKMLRKQREVFIKLGIREW